MAETTNKIDTGRRTAGAIQTKGTNQAITRRGRWLGAIALATVGCLLLWALTSAVNIESDEEIRLSQSAAATQRVTSLEQRLFLETTATLPKREREWAIEQIEQISRETGTKRREIYGNVRAIFANDINLQATIDIVWVAAMMFPENVSATAAALEELAIATGSQDTLANLGFLVAAMHESRLTTTEDFMENVVPAIREIVEFGDRDVFAAALVGAVWKEFFQFRSEKAANVTIIFAWTLKEVVPQGANTEERLALARQDPRIARQVVASLKQDHTREGLLALLDPESMASLNLAASLANLEKLTDRTARGHAFLTDVSDDFERYGLAPLGLEAFDARTRLESHGVSE
jgi:hypothetical protein